MLDKLTIAVLCIGGSLLAQQTTSPRGYLKTAGSSAYPLGMTNAFGLVAFEFIQMDDTQRGRAQTIRAIHLRRSACAYDNPTATARSLDFRMRMAHGDYSKVTRGVQVLDSLLVGKWSNVFPVGKVSFPNMVKRPASGPAPWTLRVPLKTPFVYDGKNALYFQMMAWTAAFRTSFTYPLDTIDENSSWSWGKPIPSNPVCKHKGKEIEVSADFVVGASSQRPVQFMITTFPQITQRPNETVAFLGLRSVDIKIPGACAPLLVQPMVAIPMFSFARKFNGEMGYFAALAFPHSAQLVGTQLTVQVWAPDSTQGPIRIAGSHGWRTGPLPAVPTPKTRVAVANVPVTPGSVSTRATLNKNSGLIVGLEK